MTNMLVVLAVKVLTPILVGVTTPYVLDALKRANAWLDASPPYIKQGAAIAIAAAMTGLSTVIGVELPQDIATWDTTAVKTLVAGFLAIAVKQHQQLSRLKGK